jgi:L-alanine-DL-glutamate epimerase-like enolase superfamily enzyme
VTGQIGGDSKQAPVVGLRADKVRIPFRRPFLTSTGLWLERDAWIVEVVAADGRVGLGEAVLEPRDGETAQTVLDHLVREVATTAVAGQLPEDAELIRHGAPGRALLAALAAARLDLAGIPSSRLGPGGPGVGVNATIASVGPAASAEAALQALEAGFRTIKVKAGAERETEALVDRVRAVRRAVGPEVRLRIDVNGAWDLHTAVERLSAIESFGIEYVEEPLATGDPLDLAELRRLVGAVPIAADESVTSVGAARGLIDVSAVDVLVVKLARVGGPAQAMEIASLASSRGFPVVLSTLFETGIGVAGALAVAALLPDIVMPGRASRPDHGLATAGLLEHDLLRHPLPVERGRMWLPAGHGGPSRNGAVRRGLGVELDRAALGRYTVESMGAGA